MKKILLALMAFGAFNTWEVNAAGDGTVCKSIDEAISTGNLTEVIRFVLEEKVDVNAKRCNYFPLTLAADLGKIDIVRFLCNIGANVEQRTRQFPACSHLSELFSDSVPAGFTPIFYAVHNGIDTVKCLVEEFGANPYAKNSVGETPLCYAAWEGDLILVKALD